MPSVPLYQNMFIFRGRSMVGLEYVDVANVFFRSRAQHLMFPSVLSKARAQHFLFPSIEMQPSLNIGAAVFESCQATWPSI